MSWVDHAACTGATEVFFTERGEPTAAAKAVCAGCPVPERFGVWGGTSERERRAMRALRNRERVAS